MQPWGNSSTASAQLERYVGKAADFTAGAAKQLTGTQAVKQLLVAAEPYSSTLAALYAGTGQSRLPENGGLLAAMLGGEDAQPRFVCQPCTYGQYCPEGSVLPPADSPAIQL
jgi:hypothetical protein